MAFLKERQLACTPRLEADEARRIVDELTALPGVTSASYHEATGVWRVTYDVRFVTLRKIEQLLARHGLTIRRNRWQRFVAGLVHFTEENERDAATDRPSPCCSDPQHRLPDANKRHNASSLN